VGSDIQGRYHRLLGYDVFEPMGFDAFGMHSENFALKMGRHPAEMVPRNIERFRDSQLKKVGLMLDWSHQVDTTSAGYYRWTQWMFVTLFNNGLAYRKTGPVNWCPGCKTVLAAEQVIDGQCERCSSDVAKKETAQWYFRTTAFAQELLDELDRLDWSERTKVAQRNWIGRSQGAEVIFETAGGGPEFKIFTTRPDTLFGATYMVFSPEHPLLNTLVTPEQAPLVEQYRQEASRLSEIDRQAEDRPKTGVFTGAYAINPVNGARLPIWAADYVLMGYGTGAIMAVPAHDERDHQFARKFSLPIIEVVKAPEGLDVQKESWTGEGVLVNSGEFSGLPAKGAGQKAIVEFLARSGRAKETVNYRLRDWCVSRQRYWGPPIPIIYCEKCGPSAVPEKDLPVLLPQMDNYQPDGSGLSPLARLESFHKTVCPKCGGPAERETDVSDNFLCSAWYFYRYPSAQFDDRPFDPVLTRKWLPVDLYVGGNEHAVLHLLYSRWLCRALHSCGLLDFAEPYKKFVAHGMIVRDGAKMSKSRGNIINPDLDINEFGADAFRMYLMFMGAYLEGGDFRDGGVKAMKAFLDRLANAVLPPDGESLDPEPPADAETLYMVHSAIRSVGSDIERFSYNTAIARLMELVNYMTKNQIRSLAVSRILVQLLSPLAPYLAEELWERLGGPDSVFRSRWPQYDEAACQQPEIEYVIQVNGKLRGRLRLALGLSQEEIEPLVMESESVQKWLAGKTLVKKIFVPGKLVNLVVK
jgi:leucyl-tRNA synthetase